MKWLGMFLVIVAIGIGGCGSGNSVHVTAVGCERTAKRYQENQTVSPDQVRACSRLLARELRELE